MFRSNSKRSIRLLLRVALTLVAAFFVQSSDRSAFAKEIGKEELAFDEFSKYRPSGPLVQRLGFNRSDLDEGWEVELADADRLREFAEIYLEADWEDQDRIGLMVLILLSLDEYLEWESESDEMLVIMVRNLVVNDFALHKAAVIYMSSLHDDLRYIPFNIRPSSRLMWGILQQQGIMPTETTKRLEDVFWQPAEPIDEFPSRQFQEAAEARSDRLRSFYQKLEHNMRAQ